MREGGQVDAAVAKGVMKMAQDPFRQLAVIRNASQQGKQISDCYRLMYKEALWERAFENLTGKAPDFRERYFLQELVERIKAQSFRFTKCSLQFSMRPLLQEWVVVEVIRIILQHIYEPVFSRNCYRCYANHGVHVALSVVKRRFSKATWCISGTLTDWLHKHNYQILLTILKKKISDRRFLLLIDNLLKSNLLNIDNSIRTGKTDPRMNVLQLLKEIYLRELDQFVGKLNKNFHKKQFSNNNHTILAQNEEIPTILHHTENEELAYVRYGDHFFIGLATSKKQAKTVKDIVSSHIMNDLGIHPDHCTLYFAHLEKRVPFLGYAIRHCPQAKQKGKIAIRFEIPPEKAKQFARQKGYGNLDRFEAHHRGAFIHKSEREIVSIYNKELGTFAYYYRLADNFHEITPLYYLAKKSLLKTIAQKRKMSVTAVYKRLFIEQKGTLYLRTENKRGEIAGAVFLSLPQLKKLKHKKVFSLPH